MVSATCNQCGSTELESDPNQGATVCTKCGHVIEENLIVSELQFEEGSHGAANLIGRMVNIDANYKSLSAGTMGNNMSVNSRESRETTLLNARQKIRSIGQQLRLNSLCVTMAFNFYKMALNRRLTYGRRQANVYAACLYMTCRIEGTSHMLLDLSDATQVNIFELGKTYLKLSTALDIKIPPIDPCIYIVRFSNRLHKLIGTDASRILDIELTALRLVQRMKRDWIHTGRRPSGLCGAALLVACRLNGVHCNITEIIKIVQVCETTIRKRLTEFGDTQTGRLTLDEFMTVDLEGEDDPPCFKEAKKRQKLMAQPKPSESDEQDEKFEEEIAEFEREINEKLEEVRSQKQRRLSVLDEPATNDEPLTEDNAVEKLAEKATVDALTRVLNDGDESTTVLEKLSEFRPTARSLGLTPTTGMEIVPVRDKSLLAVEVEEEEEDGELDLTGIDDDEINTYLVHDVKERLKREDLWMNVNKDYLEEQQKAAEEAVDAPPKVKRKQTKRKRAPCTATTANEAVETMLQEKRISSKINYKVLNAIMKSDLTESLMNDIDID